ncbi:MAG: hypothetical protein IT257_00055 [Chitinophagaceae bacterium]|nr:hypothetical protein [Chitinophagaceae bacterium]
MPINAKPVQVSHDLLMSDEELAFFRQYQHADISALSLQLKPQAIHRKLFYQISSRQKIQHKLPTFYHNCSIHYPAQISLEQCSSEATAQFKSSLFSGETMIDLTAGMGIDSYFFSQTFNKVIMVEADEKLASITSHNLAAISTQAHLSMVGGKSAEEFLQSYNGQADLIYIDPARRSDTGSKVFRLHDCEPDVLQLLPSMFAISRRILIKTSPLLDITLACKSLPGVKNVYVTEFNRECKELLFELERDFEGEYCIHAVNLDRNRHFSFFAEQERLLKIQYHMPETYIYEPNACLLKAGAFNSISQQLKVQKLHPHTHLYTAGTLHSNFPGRIFQAVQVLKPSKEALLRFLPEKKAHLTVRNFPASVAELRKKWQISEGGDIYLFATTLSNDEKAVLLCKKLPV